MTRNDPIGHLSRAEYLRLTEPSPRARGVRVILMLLVASTACLGATFGGFVVGKNTRSMTLREALQVLDSRPPEEWNQLAALGAVFRGTRSGVMAMDEWAVSNQPAGQEAALYLKNTARACILSIQKHADAPNRVHAHFHADALKDLEEMLR